MVQKSTIDFLKGLKKNNNREWFEANRKKYEAARADFASFIQSVIDIHSKKDPSIKNLSAKDCMFRINRDIRFSKDKSPYKTNFGASINKGGKRPHDYPGYYFHLEPGNSFAGGGLYMPMPEELKKLRQEIDYNFDGLKKILAAKNFKRIYGDLDHSEELKLSRVPRGYEQDHPAAEYLKLKSHIAMVPVTDKELLSHQLVKRTVAAFEALQPLITFIEGSLQ
jgi:uncharacterized protein (TIGR02453 family)